MLGRETHPFLLIVVTKPRCSTTIEVPVVEKQDGITQEVRRAQNLHMEALQTYNSHTPYPSSW